VNSEIDSQSHGFIQKEDIMPEKERPIIPANRGEELFHLPKIKAGFVGFGEVNSPRDLIERKVSFVREALEGFGLELVVTGPVSDDPAGQDEAHAREELALQDFDLLIVCLAGWIPSHTVIDVISPFAHKPMVLWGLSGHYEDGRLVTTADQAGTTAVRDPMEAMNFKFKYIYDTPDDPYGSIHKVVAFAEIARAAALLRCSRVGMMGYRDMRLYGTLVDGVSLRRVIGAEVDVFEMLEVVQRMALKEESEVKPVVDQLLSEWEFVGDIDLAAFDQPIRMYLSIRDLVSERGYKGVSLIDVDGVKKLLKFPPGLVMSLLMDLDNLAAIPENDALGLITQLIVRYLTGQVGAYFEFYEFMQDRVLVGVPDFIPRAVANGKVRARMARFGQLSSGVLNISKVKTGRVTLCRLASRGDRYKMHIVTGEAVSPRRWEEAGWDQPAPQLPGLEIILDDPVEDFAMKVLSQHYIISYGDHRSQLVDFCQLLGIDVI
jgi:L-fucose isomerase-like protein